VAQDATERLRQMTFPNEYRAEVVGDAVERAEARWEVQLAGIAAALLIFLLLQAATNSWRGAAVLFVAAPLAAAGPLLAAALVGGARNAGVLAAILAVVALAVRQSLVVVRRAQVLLGLSDETTPVDALRAAARDQAPPVVVPVLATAAVFMPAALMGGAGLELLQPFSIALLGGLVTSTVVVLFLVPALLATVGGLRPAPAVGPDTPDGEPGPGSASQGRHAGSDREVVVRDEDVVGDTAMVREALARGEAHMRAVRRYGIASLFLSAGLGLAGCQTAAIGAESGTAQGAATVESSPDGGPSRLTLTEEAVQRLALQTAPVAGEPGALVIPYSAVVYDAQGGAWSFVELEPRVYQRAPITITTIVGDQVTLSDGPPPASPVVTVAAAELVGVEAGISGGE
jgi:hypothetical protein